MAGLASPLGRPVGLELGNKALNRTKAGPYGGITYISPGTYTFTVPAHVYSVCVVCIGAGGAGGPYGDSPGGAGGELRWKNNIPVTPGQTINVTVGAQGNLGHSRFGPSGSEYCLANGGQGSQHSEFWGATGGIGDGGGDGGHSGPGGGAGGYLGRGANTRWGEYYFGKTDDYRGYGSAGCFYGVPTGTGLWGIRRSDGGPWARKAGECAGLGNYFCGGGGPSGGGTKPGRNGGVRVIWGAGRSFPYDAMPLDGTGDEETYV